MKALNNKKPFIFILTATYTPGDAIGSYCRILIQQFGLWGCKACLYSDNSEQPHDAWHKPSSSFVEDWKAAAKESAIDNTLLPAVLPLQRILWFHYSIFSENFQFLENASGSTAGKSQLFQPEDIKIMDFHGVSPPELFEGYDEFLASLCYKGQILLPKYRSFFDLCITHSDYSTQILSKIGYKNIEKIPFVIDPNRFKAVAPQALRLKETEKTPDLDSSLDKILTSGGDYLLFVGRIVPQKSIKEMLEVFSLVKKFKPDLRLFLIGEHLLEPYFREIREQIETLGLTKDVYLPGRIDNGSVLSKIYKQSKLYLCFSRWETFCIPLIEAMYFGIPVVAIDQPAVRETLGSGGSTAGMNGFIADKYDKKILCDLILKLLDDQDLYQEYSEKSRKRAEDFTIDKLTYHLKKDLMQKHWHYHPEKPKILFVVQRYGEEVNGGAETLCRGLAEHLQNSLEVEVASTCAIDYMTWKNEYPATLSYLKGVPIRRFANDFMRNQSEFDTFSALLFQNSNDENLQIKWMLAQGPYCLDLLRYIENSYSDYDLFIFFTYLYMPTFFGLPLVADKAVLQPMAHDENPIYLEIFKKLFQLPQGLIFNAKAEQEFVHNLMNNQHIYSRIIGSGLEASRPINPNRFREKYLRLRCDRLEKPFLLFIGRIEDSKACPELFRYFERFIQMPAVRPPSNLNFKANSREALKLPNSPSNSNYQQFNRLNLDLVLMGQAFSAIPKHPQIHYLGFLDEQDKYDGLAAALALVIPSQLESLSLVMLEAFSVGTPVLANSHSPVLKDHLQQSQAGLGYENYSEFSEGLELLIKDNGLRKKLGQNGQMYVEKNYAWDKIEAEYLEFLAYNLARMDNQR